MDTSDTQAKMNKRLPTEVLEALICKKNDEPSGRKCGQVLDAAQEVFLTHGYAGASVDDIVDQAGISKATLYKYYGDKEALFSAVIKRVCLAQRDRFEAITLNVPTHQALIDGCKMAVSFMASPLALNVFRTCVAESKRFPQVGHTFFASAALVMEEQLCALFERAEQAGDLSIEDKSMAANQFWQLCRTGYFYELIFSTREGVSQNERDHVVKATLEMFVARYGTPSFKEKMAEELSKLP